jgi:pimeloyl-ACP methyl ester carboxylesterase
VLLAWGVDDPMTQPGDAVEVFDLVRVASPFARMHWFSGCGHSPFVEHPDEFNALVVSFDRAVQGRLEAPSRT